MPVIHKSILSLDAGDARIGVAVASIDAKLPRPLTTLKNDERFYDRLKAIVDEEDCGLIIIGYPRGMQGQVTKQTKSIEAFADKLKEHISLPLRFQDESLTSKQAEAELERTGKYHGRGDVDSLAATYILEDFLNEHQVLMEDDT